MSENVVWIDNAAGTDPDKLGGKLRSLVELTGSGFAVPGGFGVSTDAFGAFSAAAGLPGLVADRSAGLDASDLPAVQAVSAELVAAVRAASMPAEVESEIRDAYGRLCEEAGIERPPVAVRSSGVNEDLEGASFAGQYETYLWIAGADDVVDHVQRCWEGLFSAEVLSYRPADQPSGADVALSGMSVVVQRMVESSCSGVAFTLDPVTGDRSKIVIESCWGLGEGVVKGDVTPDRFRFDKVTMEQLGAEISVQEAEYRFDPERNEVALLPIAGERGERSSLEPGAATAVAELAKRVERDRGGAPQDLEWAVDAHGDVFLLQARPETVWSAKQASEPKPASSAMDRVLGSFVNPAGGPRR